MSKTSFSKTSFLSPEIFNDIKGDFSSLWSMRSLGNTVEIASPYTDLYGDSIVVYLTIRNGVFIVSDGAHIDTIAREQGGINLNVKRALHYLDMLRLFRVREVKDVNGIQTYCYKSTDKIDMLSSIIYDLIHFELATLNSIYAQTLFIDEQSAAMQFRHKVTNLLKNKVIPREGEKKRLEFYTNEDIRELSFLGGLRVIGRDEIWIGMSIYSKDAINLRESVRRAEFGFNHIRETSWGLLMPNLRIGSIIDDIPQDVRDNKRARISLGAMDKWQERFHVRTYSYGEIEQQDDLSFLVDGGCAA